MFITRQHAGRQLAIKLLSGHYTADIVVGLARGGVAVSREISRMMSIPHDVLVVKKIGSPGNPELAIGATVPAGQTPDVWGKTVILTDDGAATGITMYAALAWVNKHGARKIIVALPVAPSEVARKLTARTDGIVILETPTDFYAVGEFYKNFPQLTNEDVVKLLT